MYSRATAWLKKNTVLRLRSTTSSQSFSLNLIASSRRMMPALLTRMSMRPPRLLAWATRSAGRRRRTGLARRSGSGGRWPGRRHGCRPGPVTLTPTTSAPACASATAMPWPRPVLQPVTMATRPLRLNWSRITPLLPCGERSRRAPGMRNWGSGQQPGGRRRGCEGFAQARSPALPMRLNAGSICRNHGFFGVKPVFQNRDAAIVASFDMGREACWAPCAHRLPALHRPILSSP